MKPKNKKTTAEEAPPVDVAEAAMKKAETEAKSAKCEWKLAKAKSKEARKAAKGAKKKARSAAKAASKARKVLRYSEEHARQIAKRAAEAAAAQQKKTVTRKVRPRQRPPIEHGSPAEALEPPVAGNGESSHEEPSVLPVDSKPQAPPGSVSPEIPPD